MCHRVLGPQKIRSADENLFLSRSIHDINIISGFTAAILILVGVAWLFWVPETSEMMYLWFPTDWWKPHRKIPTRSGDTGGVQLLHPPPFTLQKTSRRSRVNCVCNGNGNVFVNAQYFDSWPIESEERWYSSVVTQPRILATNYCVCSTAVCLCVYCFVTYLS